MRIRENCSHTTFSSDGLAVGSGNLGSTINCDDVTKYYVRAYMCVYACVCVCACARARVCVHPLQLLLTLCSRVAQNPLHPLDVVTNPCRMHENV